MTPRLEELVVHNCKESNGEHALWWQGAWWSRGVLLELVEDCVDTLARGGFRPGQRLAVILPNSPIFLALALAVWRLGGTLVPINPQAGTETMLRFLTHAEVAAALVPERADAMAKELSSKGIPSVPVPLMGPLPELVLCLSREESSPSVAAIFYTSGTTGRPKAVELSHENILADVDGCCEHCEEIGDYEIVMNVLPDFHAFGFTVCALLPLLKNYAQVLLPSFMPPEATLEVMRATQVTFLTAVPTMIALLVGMSARGVVFPHSVKLLISGGDRLPVKLDERARKYLGLGVLEGYGLTETSPVISVNPSYRRRKLGTVGTPIPKVEVEIRSEANEPLPPGSKGTLWVRGPTVSRGYFRDPELSAERFVGGWFDTRDIVTMDDEGYLTIISRVSDIIIVGGYNVYPKEVEDVLCEHPQVQEAAVTGIPNPISGQLVKAFVVPISGSHLLSRELVDYCRARLAPYKVPRFIEFVDALPQSGLGETLKRQMRESTGREVFR